MNVLLILIPVTGLVVLIGVALFFWAANHQQFDDLDTPGILPLLEDAPLETVAPKEVPREDDAHDGSRTDLDQQPPAPPVP